MASSIDDGAVEKPGEAAAFDATLTMKPASPAGGGHVGNYIGAYRLVREIGHGGMGTVFLAARDDAQYEKRVAIKVVRGPDSQEALRYFRRERQILAGLEHPNIARLLDGGATDDGLPYLVMEYVEGECIDTYCDQQRLGIRERLALFQAVCGAVQYAHRNLIVHRDLKPANILITSEGTPKLLDFGIAKLLSPVPGGAGETMLAMTPDYASPEQVRHQPITTSSDVYSLGVILYELLTGQRPYRVKARQPLEVLKAVVDEEPQRPSTAVSRPVEPVPEDSSTTSPTAGKTSGLREESPARLRRTLQGDLDAIVLTALQKEPSRRYESVEAFSEDIRRYLGGLPVAARKASTGYRLGKLMARHKLAVGGAALLLALLIGQAVTMTVAAARLKRERDKANAERAKVSAMNAFLQDALGAANPWEQGSRSVSLVDALRQAQSKAESSFRDQPLIAAGLLQTIGSTFAGLGNFPDGEKALRASLELWKANTGARSVEAASAMKMLAELYYLWRKLDQAESLAREQLAINTDVFGPDSLQAAAASHALAQTLVVENKLKEAQSVSENALRIARAAPRPPPGGKPSPDAPDAVAIEANALGDLSAIFLSQGDYKAQLAAAQQAVALLRRYRPADAANLAVALNNLGQAQTLLKLSTEAEATLKEVLALDIQTFGEDHPEVALVRENLAHVYYSVGRYDDTIGMLRQVLASRQKMLGTDSEAAARTHANIAAVFRHTDRYAEAEAESRQALAIMEAKGQPLDIAHVRFGLALALRHTGKLDEADALLRSALQTRTQVLGEPNPQTQLVLQELVSLSKERGKPAEVAEFQAKLVPAAK